MFSYLQLELQALPAAESGRTITSVPQKMASIDPVPALLPPITASNGLQLQSGPANCCSEGNKELTVGNFVLPDLNIPFEENSSCDVLCGVS